MITLDESSSSDDEEVKFLGVAAEAAPEARNSGGDDDAKLIRADAEVVFAGVKGTKGSGKKRRRSGPASIAAPSRNDSPIVQFVGTRRPRHSVPSDFGSQRGSSSAAGAALSASRKHASSLLAGTSGGDGRRGLSSALLGRHHRDRRSHSFGGMMNRAFLGEETADFHNPYGHAGYHEGPEGQRQRGGRGHPPPLMSSSKKRRADKHDPPAETAMQKGKRLAKPQGFDAIDIFYPKLKANERTLILYNLLQSTSKFFACSHSKKFVNEWRVKFDKTRAKATLWDIARALADDIVKHDNEARLNLKLPARTLRGTEGSVDENKNVKPTAIIGPVSGDVLDTLQTHFVAYLDKSLHKAALEAIGSKEGDDCITCSICADTFDPQHTVACTGDDLHFFCKPCMEGYCTLTVQKGAIQSMPCPVPGCESLFATQDVKSTLSSWDVLRIERREDAINRRVATAAKAMLHCECGVVAIITEEDMGDGRVTCPGAGCGRRYCAKCGNDDHGTAPCPPPAETVQWLEKNSKECPNCRNRIEKAGGCDHMTCYPSAGGCGHEFWWTCGCPYRGQHTCGLRR